MKMYDLIYFKSHLLLRSEPTADKEGVQIDRHVHTEQISLAYVKES